MSLLNEVRLVKRAIKEVEKAKLSTMIGLTTKHAVCYNTLMS